jgi:capsular exopolysaccharide synthesis family protein
MSRIYEALTRAGNDVTVEEPQRGVQPAPASALEHYAAEGWHAFDRGDAALPLRQDPVRIPAPGGVDLHPAGPPAADFRGKVMGVSTGGSVSAERYVNLATVLHETQLEQGLQTLLITSSARQEGKTLTVVNLATTLSDAYARRVLIIDADLRRPSVHRALGIDAQTGLSDALLQPASPLPLIHVTPRLSVLPAGRPDANPLARLSPDRVQPLLADCVSRFDWVLVDTPPVGTEADAQLLARFVQAVIFVIRAGVAPYSVVQRAVAELGRECIIGTVLNGVDESLVPAVSPYSRFASRQ